MLNNLASRDYILEMLNKEIDKDSNHVIPEFVKYLSEKIERSQVKSLREYSIKCINQSVAAVADCRYINNPHIDRLELPNILKMDLNISGFYGFDIQFKLNNALRRELGKDDLNPFEVKVWLDMGAKIDTEGKSIIDSALKRTIEDNKPIFAKAWLSMGGMIPDFQHKIDQGLQQARTVFRVREWHDLGAPINNNVQLKLNEWLKGYLEKRDGLGVRACLSMGATTENLQQQLDDCMTSMLLENKPDSGDLVTWKELGANIKPEFQTILDSNLERVARENNVLQFECWLELGANQTDEAKRLINLAAQRCADQSNAYRVKAWVDLGANSPYSQDELNTMFQTEVRKDQPFLARFFLELGAEVSSDIQAQLNAGLLRAITNNRTHLIKSWMDIGASLSFEQV
ncbi:hypothetical protein [Endozoicomonas sp. SCSIO W0465]|uniref:hypothetical protein n=1 Tax=Endozoicomonas sp. SCSIO W0465 TaxID=2918516 RepID=UPI0020764563|nr:hypothetical protein [Endozoicomonas sp. SCSIO W0465]USE39173.1 hypothetical protein MJO57_14070 [Endozoicomonas sp. SCSIO W0465]